MTGSPARQTGNFPISPGSAQPGFGNRVMGCERGLRRGHGCPGFSGNYVHGLDHSGNFSTDNNAIRIKSNPTCGGLAQRVTYANTCVTQSKHLIVVTAYYGTCRGTPGTPQFKDIVINGVNAINSQSGAYSRIQGFDTDHLAQLFLANVSLDATAQSGDENAAVSLDNSNMTPSGPNVTTGTFSTSGSVPICAF